MNFKIIASLLTVILSASTALAADNTFDRTLTVSGAPTVSITTGSGYIHLRSGSDSQVHILGHVHASQGWFGGGGDSRVQEIVRDPPIVQTGNEITIGPEHRGGDLYHNISIDYDVTVPRASILASTTGSGDITIESVGASVKAQSGSGTVRANGIQGTAILGTGSGDIELQQTGQGDVKAETGSGSVRLSGIAGALKATTGSGDIEVAGQPTADWRVSTGSGSIHLTVGNARFNLNADTGSGDINLAQPITMQGSLNHHHVSGSVNGGGPFIHANTGSGDIRIN